MQLDLDSRLRGRDYGRYEDQPVGSIDWDEEGETFEHEDSYTQRIRDFMREITSSGNTKVLVVTHGGVVRRVLHYECGKEREAALQTDIPNASVLIVDTSKKSCSLL